ncbi:FAD-dependent thymidylate synthase [Chrysiogenes arsenatis]|uniref:FAD-dependent thymidylate synthase n=1 Tax=Chrysiogenes arsenatis TaxID=309797 RepID=UPI00042A45C5|nr:FAD-dependent thymidylate synthase [Chrysiogenes arsenatis]
MRTPLQVALLKHTDDPEGSVFAAARLCYSGSTITDLVCDDQKKKEQFVAKIRDLGHLSVFEHVSFTFAVEGISRACSHQLVRHRLASYSQQSQRYVKQNQFGYIEPPTISATLGNEWFSSRMALIQEWYDEALAAGIPAEDARFVLPNACETKIIITMNARELLHFFSLRCCNRAQWEIKLMADEMLRHCLAVAPSIFCESGPGCVRGICPEGTMYCGKIKDVREFYADMKNTQG